jgi:multiple sugar transport system substrate-binding protein
MRLLTIIVIALSIVVPVFCGASFSSESKPATVVFLTWKPNQPETWKRLIHRFHKKHPAIHIQLQVGPHSSTEYHAIVAQRLKNKDASVDVFFMDVIWPPEFASAGWAADLSNRFSLNERKKFLSGPIEANTYGGKTYGIPCYLAAGLFYFRKDLLEKHGLKAPTSWNEMLKQGRVICEGEKDSSLNIYSAQFKQYEGLVCNMLEFIWSHGGRVMDPKSGRVLLTDPEVINALAFVRDRIIGKAAPRGAINYEEPESLDLFIQGKAVFHRNWPYAWSVANDPQKSRVAGRVGVGSLPAFAGHGPASALGGWQFGINRWSRQPDRAWKFIQFMTSSHSQKLLALQAGLAPTRRSVYKDADVRQQMPHLSSFLPAFENAKPRPLSPIYTMISQELQRFFSRAIVDNRSSLSDLAKATSARIEKLARLGASIRP